MTGNKYDIVEYDGEYIWCRTHSVIKAVCDERERIYNAIFGKTCKKDGKLVFHNWHWVDMNYKSQEYICGSCGQKLNEVLK